MIPLFISIGLFVCTISLFLIFTKWKSLNRLKRPGPSKTYFLIKELRFKMQKKLAVLKKNRKQLLLAFGGATVAAIGLSRSLGDLFYYLPTCFIISFLAINFTRKTKRNAARNKKLKDLAMLFEAVEMYMKAGYTIYQSLSLARALTPNISREIEICLSYWSENPRKALEKFKDELNLEEGEVLVSLLIHMESAGRKNLSGLLLKEAFNIERLRRLRIETDVSLRPLYIMVYRFIPLASALGIIAGPLLYRTYLVMVNAGLMLF
jgi:hypothetical protein